METRAKFAVVGGFTLAVLVAAFGFIWWFAGSRGGSDRTAYLVRFQGAVSGLSTGASVLFNGLRVGEVATLDLAQDDPNVVVARIEVQPRTPVKSDTIARLEFQGLTGIASVQLTGGTLEASALKGENGALPVIRAERSDFQNLLETAQRISGRVDTVVARIEKLVADNEGVAGRTLRNVESFTGALADNAPAISGFLASTTATAERVSRLSIQAERLAGDLDAFVNRLDAGAVNRTVANVEAITGAVAQNREAINGFVTDAAALARRLNGSAEKLDTTLNAVTEITRAVEPARIGRLVENADRFAASLGANAGTVNQVLKDAGEIGAKLNAASTNVEALTGTLAQNRDAVTALVTDAGSLARRLNGTAEKLDAALTGVTEITRAVEPVRIGRVIENADKFAASLGANAGTVNQVFKDAGEIAAKLNVASNRVDSVLRGAEGLLGSPETQGTIKEAQSTLTVARAAFIDFGAASRGVREAAANLDKRFAEISGSLGRFTASGQREVEALANESRRALGEVNRVVRGVEKNPQQFLLGPRGTIPEYRGR